MAPIHAIQQQAFDVLLPCCDHDTAFTALGNSPENPIIFSSNFRNEIDGSGYLQQIAEQGFLIFEGANAQEATEFLRWMAMEVGVCVEHTKNGDAIWDIQYDPQEQSQFMRSKQLVKFPLHTDGCFEDPPPRFVGLAVIRADRQGGGRTSLVDFRPIIEQLNDEDRTALKQPMRWKVLKEFNKGKNFIVAPLLGESGGIRYRTELIIDAHLTASQKAALAHCAALVTEAARAEFLLKDNQVIIIDNWSLLHERTEVKDTERLLRRARFQRKQGNLF